jgi:hypothetical protein
VEIGQGAQIVRGGRKLFIRQIGEHLLKGFAAGFGRRHDREKW